MTQRAEFDKIELSLIRVLHTLITERSVSRSLGGRREVPDCR